MKYEIEHLECGVLLDRRLDKDCLIFTGRQNLNGSSKTARQFDSEADARAFCKATKAQKVRIVPARTEQT